jgi:hypothetical protein
MVAPQSPPIAGKVWKCHCRHNFQVTVQLHFLAERSANYFGSALILVKFRSIACAGRQKMRVLGPPGASPPPDHSAGCTWLVAVTVDLLCVFSRSV